MMHNENDFYQKLLYIKGRNEKKNYSKVQLF